MLGLTSPSSATQTAPTHTAQASKRTRGKADQILAGLRRLSARAVPGQPMTPTEIATECGVRERAITYIERRAQYNFARRLQAMHPTLLAEIFDGSKLSEILSRPSSDPYCTGRPGGRNNRSEEAARRRKLERRGMIECEVSLTEVAKILENRNSEFSWGKVNKRIKDIHERHGSKADHSAADHSASDFLATTRGHPKVEC